MAIKDRIKGLRRVPAGSLVPNARNWRTHPTNQVDAMRGLLVEIGWADAVLAREVNGKLHLIDGHLRKDLAPDDEVPVLVLDVSEAEADKILATHDPIAAMATADEKCLGELLQGMRTEDSAVQSMLDDLAAEHNIDLGAESAEDPGAEIDKAAELQKKWGTEIGQVWVVEGKSSHRVVCGDCWEHLPDKTDVVLTDPPYGMNLDTDWTNLVGNSRGHWQGHGGKKYEKVVGDDAEFDPTRLFDICCDEMFLFGADYYAERIPKRTGGSWLVWDKRLETQAGGIGSEFELIWSRVKHKRRMLRHDWFGFCGSGSENNGEARQRFHPTQKPSALLVDILQQWSPEGCEVADPFLGSGTTLVACEQLGRRGYGIEIAPKYVAVTLERMSKMDCECRLEK